MKLSISPKENISLLVLALVIAPLSQSVNAVSLNGTSSIVWQNAPYVFRNGDIAQGYVRLNEGFTLNNTSFTEMTMDTFITVSGAIDMRGQVIQLLGNLTLDSNVTLTSGGGVYGRGKMITLQSGLSFTPTSTMILHIQNDTIIDGRGTTLTLGDYAQIFVDSNVSLTLRNMVIKSSPKSTGFPPIRLASLKSKLTLDHVWMPLSADFHFYQGQLFIQNDVSFTGTSAFVYQSSQPSVITSGGLLYFDNGTTLSYAPATNASSVRDLLVLTDAKSALYLNGCSLSATHSGLRLTTGMLLFDNRVQVNSLADYDLNATTAAVIVGSSATTGASPQAVAWSPNGNVIAVANQSGNSLQLFSFNRSGTPTQVGGTIATGASSNPQSLAWSNDGRFIAVVNAGSSPSLQVYAYNTPGTPVQVGSSVTAGLSAPFSVAWSPDGKFVALVNKSGNNLQVYAFNGTSTPAQIGSNATTNISSPTSVAWSPDGASIVVANNGSTNIQVYTFNGTSTPTVVGSTASTTTAPVSASWSPDGTFIAVVAGTSLQIFSYSNSTPTLVGSAAVTGAVPQAVTWSPDGRFVAQTNNGGTTFQIWSFNGSSTPTAVGGAITTTSAPYAISWSQDGNFIAVTSPGGNAFQVFQISTIKTANPQALSSSVVFSNHALTSASNLNTQFLSAARIEVNGAINDDSV